MSLTYKLARIPKGRGKYRSIYIPNREYMEQLKSYLPYLESKLKKLDTMKANFAFIKNKNCVAHAYQHLGYKYTLSVDIENFFDCITREHVKGLVPSEMLLLCFIDGAPRQGLPTSPAISNLAFLDVDKEISKSLRQIQVNCCYTRYADDLYFSFDNKRDHKKIKVLVETILKKHGFVINKSKSKFQSIRNGRIIITGIALDEDGIYPTRKIKKKIRAAIHQENRKSERGLVEWSKCKLPNN